MSDLKDTFVFKNNFKIIFSLFNNIVFIKFQYLKLFERAFDCVLMLYFARQNYFVRVLFSCMYVKLWVCASVSKCACECLCSFVRLESKDIFDELYVCICLCIHL